LPFLQFNSNNFELDCKKLVNLIIKKTHIRFIM